jgi:hypothetical protein
LDTTPGLSFTLEDLVRFLVRPLRPAAIAVRRFRSSSPGVSRPFDAPSSGNPLPGGPSPAAPKSVRFRLLRSLSPSARGPKTFRVRFRLPPYPSGSGSHLRLPAPPRRGFPHPLRSAFAVSHDLDGLLLPEPCGVFQPLTSVGFVSPAPWPVRSSPPLPPKRLRFPVSFQRRHRGDSALRNMPWPRGWSSVQEAPGWPRSPARFHDPFSAAAAPATEVSGPAPASLAFVSHLVRHPAACATLADGLASPGCPGSATASSRSEERSVAARCARPRRGGASPARSRPPAPCYRCRRSFPPGCRPFQTCRAPDQPVSRRPDRLRLPAFPSAALRPSSLASPVGSPKGSPGACPGVRPLACDRLPVTRTRCNL